MNSPRLLLADRFPIVRDSLRAVLRAERPECEICGLASTALDAIAQAVAFTPDVVLIGYEFPDSNGLDAALEIMRRAPQVELLLFTGADSPAVLHRLYHSKVRGCLLKTEPVDELLLALESVRRHHRFRSHALTVLCEEMEPGRAKYKTLTKCETEITLALADGYLAKEVADQRKVSPRTIDSHRTHIFRKLGVRSIVELVRHAIHHGIVEVRTKPPK